jgi:DNA-binding MarR family transcriptional regulator
MDIVSVINRPQRDEMMVRQAARPLDRALFPLVVIIERRDPIGVVELAERVGRDHTTVSRQVAKLESLGLVERRAAATDRRVSEATVTAKGKAMTDAVDMDADRWAWPFRNVG